MRDDLSIDPQQEALRVGNVRRALQQEVKTCMVTGKVKFFNGSRGFGFIVRDDGAPDVYVNAMDVKGGRLSENDRVKFDVEQAERGPRAKNVEKI